MNLKIFVLFSLTAFFLISLLTGGSSLYCAEYYVSTIGNDGNPGTQALPKATVSAGIALLTDAGDILYIATGTYEQDEDTEVEITVAGTSTSPITIRPLLGPVVIEKPRIVFKSDPISPAKHWIIKDLTFSRYPEPSSIEIGQLEAGHKEVENITIEGCKFKDATHEGVIVHFGKNIVITDNTFKNLRPREEFEQDPPVETNAIGVSVVAKNLTIDGNIFEDIGSDGIQLGTGSNQHPNTMDITHVNITNNIFRVVRNPYKMYDLYGVEIKDHPDEDRYIDNVGENGVDIKLVKGPTLIKNNQFSGFYPGSSCQVNGDDDTEQDTRGGRGEAIVIHFDAKDITIENNEFRDNRIHIAIEGDINGAGVPEGVTIQNNLFEDLSPDSGPIVPTCGAPNPPTVPADGRFISMKDCDFIEIYYNTFYTTNGLSPSPSIIYTNNSIADATVDMQNNIFYKNGDAFTEDQSTTPNWTVGYNLFYDHSGLDDYDLIPTLFTDEPNDEHGDNPNLDTEFKIQYTSPAYNEGVSIAGITQDAFGNSRVECSVTDIGWHETQNCEPLLRAETESLSSFVLMQNTPNPFNPSTKIFFQLPREHHVNISVYNTLGQLVTTLVDETIAAGYHSIEWNGTTDTGTMAPAGIYIYRLEAEGVSIAKKMLFMK